ncbi:hypothetical protein MPTK1_5g08870 [Marchantia polymorpha subsp. ruderalis]|uniref:Uncharacterized protein n=4 Tax=Marchantia polymorpha TaxID=3197 RepID=A0AAF6BGE6_MARPO|nr:hypothetical protein MARPO_0095s0071 [Marchantia polymorpha]BBN11080.1 hypothetical protein Mp_5g08870 [Marchantia polymorpha subsp. ruderalis]|eukprot:PTQ32816.1 hypothetical protein MARPO_0095s0071 [Marchantia polymorpha]
MTILKSLRNSTFTASAVFQGMLSVHSQISLCKAHSISKQPLSSGQSSLRVINSNKRKLVQSTAFDSHQCSTHSFSVSAKMDVENSPPPSDRCAIITGVARSTGIGRILVHHFLKNGYKVVGADVKELELKVTEGRFEEDPIVKHSADRFYFVRADISDPLQAKRIVDEAIEKFGGAIHVLINNAGITNPMLAEENRIKAFADTIAVNLNGAYYMSQCVLPYMPAGQSSIIHMASTRALQSEPNTEGYAASKAGLCGLSHAQAITLAGRVRVNAVLPGWINTDPSGDAALRPEDHEWHPAGRVGVPNDVAHLCFFLCDSERAGFITGQEFVIDGGATKKMVYPE